MKIIVEKLKSLAKDGMFHIFMGNILVKAIGFISSIVVVRLVSKEEYASLSYATNIYSYLSLISGLGIGSAMLKFCSSDENVPRNHAFLKFSVIYGLIADTLFVCLILLISSIADLPFDKAFYYLVGLSALQLLSCILSILQIFIRTERKNKLYGLIGVINAVVILLAGWLLTKRFDGIGYVIAQYIGTFIACLICIISVIYSRNKIKESNYRLSKEQIKPFIYMGLSLMISNLFSGMMPINETFLVNNIIKDEIISANFKVAGLIPAQLSIVTGSIVIYYFPIVARLDSKEKQWKLSKKVGIVSGLIIFVITLVGMLLTPWIIEFVYGEKYKDAISMSYILWIMRAINAGIRVVPLNMLPAIGKTKFNAWCAVISCVVLTTVDYFFLLLFGIQGVSYGAVIVYLLSGIALWIYLFRVCHKVSMEAHGV